MKVFVKEEGGGGGGEKMREGGGKGEERERERTNEFVCILHTFKVDDPIPRKFIIRTDTVFSSTQNTLVSVAYAGIETGGAGYCACAQSVLNFRPRLFNYRTRLPFHLLHSTSATIVLFTMET